MPKRKYFGPLYFLIIGFLLLLGELRMKFMAKPLVALGLFPDWEIFLTALLTFLCLCFFGIYLSQLWLHRFQKDQKWLLFILGLLIPVCGTLLYYDKVGVDNPDLVLSYFGLWCLMMGMAYMLRQWRKPPFLQTRFTRPKTIFALLIFGGGFVLGMMALMGIFRFSYYGGKNGFALGIYILILVLGMPLLFFFHGKDLQARDRGELKDSDKSSLIDQLGENE